MSAWILRLACLFALGLGGCVWHRGEPWSFALTESCVGEGPDVAPDGEAEHDLHPFEARKRPMEGGVDEIWLLLLAPVAVPFALDCALLPITGTHDAWLRSRASD